MFLHEMCDHASPFAFVYAVNYTILYDCRRASSLPMEIVIKPYAHLDGLETIELQRWRKRSIIILNLELNLFYS